MELREDIQNELKSGDFVIGYRNTIKYVKSNKPKIVVVAKNAPENLKKEVSHSSNSAGVRLETFDGSSVDLGVFCGRPFPIAFLTIK